MIFLGLRHEFGRVRPPHNRQVEDGRPLPFESFWAHHLIDSYRLSIEESVRLWMLARRLVSVGV